MSPRLCTALVLFAVLSSGCVRRGLYTGESELERYDRPPPGRYVLDPRDALDSDERHAFDLRAAALEAQTGLRLYVLFTESLEPAPRESLAALATRWGFSPTEGAVWISTEDRRAAFRTGPAFGSAPFGQHFDALSLHVLAGNFAEASQRALIALEPETKAHVETWLREAELADKFGVLHTGITPLWPCAKAVLDDADAGTVELSLRAREGSDGGVEVVVTSSSSPPRPKIDRCFARGFENARMQVKEGFEATVVLDGARPGEPSYLDVGASLPPDGPPVIRFAVLPGTVGWMNEVYEYFRAAGADDGDLKACYGAALSVGPEAEGGISLGLYFNQRGEVLSVTPLRVAQSVSKGETFDCLLEVAWRAKISPATSNAPRSLAWTWRFLIDRD